MSTDLADLQSKLWETADQLRANSGLRPSEYSTPVLGLIFLRYADLRFAPVHEQLETRGSARRKITRADYHAAGVLFVPEAARFAHLVGLPEDADLGKAIDEAMAAIEADNPDLAGVLPRGYPGVPDEVLVELLRLLHDLPASIEGDRFGLVYEYFLGQFAFSEGQKGGEFFTPTSLVKLIVEILEPDHGKVFDPACGSGGMFVQSARFVERHGGDSGTELSIYGTEKVRETVRLAQMNLAVHGLEGQVREANTYYDDPFDSAGTFDFVMANPPFNVNKVDKARLDGDARFPYGMPRPDNANYLWIQIFASALCDTGRAGFVMANSASDASGSEAEIRRRLIDDGLVDVMVAVGSNFFYTVTLPATLWFFDKAKRSGPRADEVLFIDARDVYNQIDRAHRDWRPEQLEFLANIVRLWRGDEAEHDAEGSAELLAGSFPDGTYVDVPGLCKVATRAEIEAQGWSLNPGRYVGIAEVDDDDEDFDEKLGTLHAEFTRLSDEAEALRAKVDAAVTGILGR